MATDLRDRLGDLASHTPPGSPPADLWQRGVRRRRIARAGAATLVLALIALLGAGGLTWHAGRERIQPAGPQGTPHLPDRFFIPSPWLPAFGGPPGQLVAVGMAERKSVLHTWVDLYGVTASGSRYGFLDIADLADLESSGSPAPPVLSPDGRSVAFWVTGKPSGSPNTELNGQTVTGVAVYDASTGRVRTVQLPTVHGLAPQGLLWSDSRTLVMDVGQAVSGDGTQLSTSSHGAHLIAWRLEDRRPTRLDVPRGADAWGEFSEGHGFVLSGGAGAAQHWLLWPREPDRDRWVSAPQGDHEPVAGPGARTLASVPGRRNPNRLLVGAIPSGHRAVAMDPVSDARQYVRPLVWTDRHHVAAVVRNPVKGAPSVTYRMDLVDVDTGSARTLVDERGEGDNWQGLSFAADLLSAPSTHGSPPSDPWDRRAVALGLLIGAVALLGLLGWGLGVRRA
jgi:hypothetical protein